MSSELSTVDGFVYSLEKGFESVNSYKLSFKKEANFALQILKSNNFLREKASANPDSLQNAITNIAAIGISLNPALKESYLVPRGNQVCLDISYIGLVKLATDTGAIEWVQAEIVKKNDVFEYVGVGKAPLHKMNPFSDRGEMVGVYCVAKLSTGESLSTVMSTKEIQDIRDKSSQASKSGPWVTFFEEMAKKSVIKRASKLWPKSERLQQAVEVINEHEGIDFSREKGAFINEPSSDISADDKTFKNIRDLLIAKNFTEERLITYLNKKFDYPSKGQVLLSIDDFQPAHIEESYRIIGSNK